MSNRLSILPPYQRAIAKGHLCSCGADYAGLERPVIAVVNSWNEIVPGHAHLRDLAQQVKQGIRDAGGYPLEFNTIAVCDGITQSHNGMKFVLPSRELIADSIEVMIRSHGIFDGMVLLGSCDKIVPAMLMAAARLNIPSIMVTGGPMVNKIKPSQSKKARRQFMQGEIDEKTLVDVTLQYYPNPGICPFLGTANTMCIVAEALGMSLPGSTVIPSLTEELAASAYNSGKQVLSLVEKNIRPGDILTKEAFHNAISVVAAIGGSLNTVLHLPAIAGELGLSVSLDDFDRISRETPFIAKVYPNNSDYTVADLYPVGGVPAIMKELSPLLQLDARTVNECTIAENIQTAPLVDGEILRPLSSPFEPEGGIAVLKGNLAPEGAVVKISAVDDGVRTFVGPARVFESEEDCMEAAYANLILPGEVVIIRNEGPSGGPGMREMHRATEVLARVGNVAIVTDGRFSGASYGLAVGYLSPEAAAGGPIALVETGDPIEINLTERRLNMKVADTVLAERLAKLIQKKRTETESNFLRMYSATTLAAAQGAMRKTFE